MKLFLPRNKNFISPLYIDNNIQCLIIENPKLAIPAGTYEINFLYSYHFQRYNPHLQDVPGRDGIEIHTASFYSDLEGCLGTGREEMPPMANPKNTGEPWVIGSSTAYIALIDKMITYAFNAPMALYDVITITITDPVVA